MNELRLQKTMLEGLDPVSVLGKRSDPERQTVQLQQQRLPPPDTPGRASAACRRKGKIYGKGCSGNELTAAQSHHAQIHKRDLHSSRMEQFSRFSRDRFRRAILDNSTFASASGSETRSAAS